MLDYSIFYSPQSLTPPHPIPHILFSFVPSPVDIGSFVGLTRPLEDSKSPADLMVADRDAFSQYDDGVEFHVPSSRGRDERTRDDSDDC